MIEKYLQQFDKELAYIAEDEEGGYWITNSNSTKSMNLEQARELFKQSLTDYGNELFKEFDIMIPITTNASGQLTVDLIREELRITAERLNNLKSNKKSLKKLL